VSQYNQVNEDQTCKITDFSTSQMFIRLVQNSDVLRISPVQCSEYNFLKD